MARRPRRRPRYDSDDFLPYGRQLIEDDDVAAVVKALRGDWLTTGPTVRAFEEQLAARLGAARAVSCASGTAGLHMATVALGLGPGSRAVVPTLNFAASANALRLAGAEPVFCDVDPDSGLMRPADLEAALSRAAQDDGPPVKAVIPVHLNGQCVNLAAISEIARRHDMAVIVDAAHAIGASYLAEDIWWPVGSGRHADATVFSFHAVSMLCMGEGGAVTTDDPELAARLMILRNHGIDRDAGGFENEAFAFDPEGGANPWYYEIAAPGFNYRVTDMQCALGLSQLHKLERFVARRAELVALYDRGLASAHSAISLMRRPEESRPAWAHYAVLIDFAGLGADRAAVMHGLASAAVGTMVHFVPLHLHPAFAEAARGGAFPDAMKYYERALSLPLFPAMTDADVDRVLAGLKRIFEID